MVYTKKYPFVSKILIILCFFIFTLSGCFSYFLSATKLLLIPKIDSDKLTKIKGLELEQEAYSTRCSSCHILIEPSYYTTDNIYPIVNRYVEQKIINEKEAKKISLYLRTMVNKKLYVEEEPK
jgi:hypothetical protein